MSELPEDIAIADSVTKLGPDHRGRVLICASHGGVYAGYLAAKAQVRAVILNDAGVGKDEAGIGSLRYLDEVGLPAATVACMSARIGDAEDSAARGRISFANARATALGCEAGMSARDCAVAMRGAPDFSGEAPVYAEARYLLWQEAGKPQVWGLDSASLVKPEDAGQIVITASHGGLLGGRPKTALAIDALAAAFNDAGVGIDEAGISRLPALDRRGIAAVTVDCRTARIGDARSSWQTGRISHMNACAERLGVEVGMSLPDFVACIGRARQAKGA